MSSQRFSITLFLLASLFALTNLTTAAPAVLDTLTSTGYAPVGPAILGIQAPLRKPNPVQRTLSLTFKPSASLQPHQGRLLI